MRRTFHEELKGLQEDILKMGSLVEQCVHDAIRALVEGDIKLAEKVIAGDDVIDALNLSIEERSMHLLARQSPVARDLRLIHSILFIIIHLERMGDLSYNLAKMARKKTPVQIKSLVDTLQEMGILAGKLVHASLEAFANRDAKLAAKLAKMDEPIDDLFKVFFKDLAKYAGQENMFDAASYMILAARYIERIADHAVDIGERVNYLVTGHMKEMD